MANQLEYVAKRIAELCKEIEDLIDYLDLLKARAQNFGKKRYSTKEIRTVLGIK